jgi:SAM-dependent methyltransferase
MTDEADRNAAWAAAFWKIHRGLQKQGPGSDTSTRRALEAVGPLPESPAILDLGCGPGRQTVVLAEETGGTVSAVDLLPPFLEQTEKRAQAAGLGDRISIRQASMGDLDDLDGAYDLIWVEGSIYNIGFSNGLRKWKPLLRGNACIAVTEVSWLAPSPPRPLAAARYFRFLDRTLSGDPESRTERIATDGRRLPAAR